MSNFSFSALRARVAGRFNIDIAHHRIAKGMGAVGLFVLIGKFAGAGKEMAVAYRYGVSEIVDVYVLAYTLLMLAPMIWTVVLSMTYVSVYKRLDAEAGKLFTRQLTGLSLVLGGFFSLLTAVCFPLLIPWLWSEYSPEAQLHLKNLFIGLSPTVLAVFLSSQFAAQLLAMEKHSNTLMDGVPSLILAFALLLMPDEIGVSPFVIGGILGVMLQLVGLTMILRSNGGLSGLSVGFTAEGWRSFADALGILLVSQFIMSWTTPADLLFAAELGSGTVATYGYAQRLLLLGMTLGATAVGRAILPVLTDVDRNTGSSIALAIRWSNILIGIGLVAIFLGWFLTPAIVSLLFERGEFSATDTVNVANTVRVGLLQLPVYFAGMVLIQFAVSQQKYNWLLHTSIISLAVKVVFAWLLSLYFGLSGIVFSSVLMYLSTFLYLLYRMRGLLEKHHA